MNRIFYFLYILTITLGCSSKPEQIPEINLSFSAPVTQVSLKDFTDNLQIIRLETNDSILIPAFYNYLLGEKYIIVQTGEAIYQFDKTGKYIRKLFTKGRGPQEFYELCSHYIDNAQDRYFMIDFMNRLFCYDLQKGQPLKTENLPVSMDILNISGDTLLCSPNFTLSNSGASTPFTYCEVSTQGKIIRQLDDTIQNGNIYSVHTCLTDDGQIRLKTNKSDTVYTICHHQKIPAYIVKGKFKDPRFPLLISPKQETRDHYFFHASSIATEYKEDGTIGSISVLSPTVSFRVNKQTLEAEIINNIYIDTLGISYAFNYFLQITPSATSFSISAFQFREALRQKAEKQPLSPELEKLYQETKDDDNPLIFVGTTKKLK